MLQAKQGLSDDDVVSQDTSYFCSSCPPSLPFVGLSPGICEVLDTIKTVGASGLNPILIMGETGTGKEMVARAVHLWRCGEAADFVAVNCASLSETLLESELFGHVKGAFTSADRDKTGLFELAGSGTLFLDEISEIPTTLQAKLLRVLQERCFRKVGGTKEVPCQATVVATTNRSLTEEVEVGAFRRDLYYRLAVLPVIIPPLRSPQRRSDIPLLAEYFLKHSPLTLQSRPSGISNDAMDRLMAHPWPGNVRELKNVMDRAIILANQDEVTAESLRFDTQSSADPESPGQPSREDFSLEAAEREFILRALKETGWQRNRAAVLLGITRTTLYAKLKRYDIKMPPVSGFPSDQAWHQS
ncbi:MAG: sigma-54 dependent transcriptional regulator [Planctomycetaceae bacterium]|nr:sigma-54 dependent transcriptional regulator [Planctomycetaceae bacterium]